VLVLLRLFVYFLLFTTRFMVNKSYSLTLGGRLVCSLCMQRLYEGLESHDQRTLTSANSIQQLINER